MPGAESFGASNAWVVARERGSVVPRPEQAYSVPDGTV